MIRLKKNLALLLIFIFSIACSTAKRVSTQPIPNPNTTIESNKPNKPTRNKPTKPISKSKFVEEISKKWQLVDNELESAKLYLSVSNQNNRLVAKGYSGCNSFSSDVMIEKSSISFDRIIGAKSSCKIIEQEQHFLQLLAKANSYTLINNELKFYLDKILLLRFLEVVE